ncbi:MAG: DUF4097 family beta strand repeat-containing protein [Candidatus Aminicenantales bacterium]
MKRPATAMTGIWVAWLVFLTAPVIAAASKETYQEPFEKTVTLARDGRVQISNISGDIEVRTWSEGQVRIKAIKTSRASSLAQAKEDAARVTIEISEEGNVLLIETKYPRSGRFWDRGSANVSVDYWLWIPERAGFKASNVSGDVDVEGVGGALDLKAVSGDLKLRKVNARAECSAVSGDIEVADIAGDAFLKSVSGDLMITGIKGSIEAETVSGDIQLTGITQAQTVRVKALSGEIVYQGTINPTGNYNLKSHSGAITLSLPPDSAFDLEAETFSGTFRTDFEIKVTGKISSKEMSGVVNGGGAPVRLSSFSGDIKLLKS